MNIEAENFAYKVRRVLHDGLDGVSEPIASKLEKARKNAIANKKPDSPFLVSVYENIWATTVGSITGPNTWLQKISLCLPAFILAFGLMGIYHHEQQKQITELAEIDSEVLSDVLPPTAYADSGFKMYVSDQTSIGA